jgi:hypothetical protein
MGSKLSDIRQTVRQILKDEFAVGENEDWQDDEIDVHISTCLLELSSRSPYKAFEPLTVTANSRVLDISGITGMIKVNRIEYEAGGNPRNYHNFGYLDNQTIEMDIDAGSSESGVSGTLAGTVTFTSGSATVTGSGTTFTAMLKANDFIKPSTKSRWYRVDSVQSNTSLTLDEPVKNTDSGVDTAESTMYRSGAAVGYYDKLHILTEDTSTLNPKEESALILGVCGHAAVSKAKYLMNRVNTGGGNVASQMEGWGLTKTQLYQQALNRLQPPGTTKRYET